MVKSTIYNVIFFILLCSVFIYLCDGDIVKSRPRRYLNFLEKIKVFVRLNTKHNMVTGTRIYAQATGFRVNYDVPVIKFGKRRHKIGRRDLYQNLEELVMRHGFDGRACVLRNLCEASRVVTPQSGILLKLYKKIFTVPEGDSEYYPYLMSEECEELRDHCPLPLLELSKFTDD